MRGAGAAQRVVVGMATKIAGAGFPTQASKPGAGIPADGVVVPLPAVYFAARFEVRAHCVIIK